MTDKPTRADIAGYVADQARELLAMAQRCGLTDLARMLDIVRLQAMLDAGRK
jgi:hypothetical protein